MKLDKLKKRLANMNPFIVFTFNGVDGCLVEEGTPLSVQTVPPTVSWLLESGQVTSLILRYSETYQKAAENAKNVSEAVADKPAIAKEIMQEISEKVLGSDEDKIKQVSVITRLGKDYLVNKTVYGWYGDEADKFPLAFVFDKEEADRLNEQSSEKLYIWIDVLDDMELVSVASEMINVMPTETTIPNIPIKDTIIGEDGEVQEGVIDSVPADKVARFPRNTRSIAVEDVP